MIKSFAVGVFSPVLGVAIALGVGWPMGAWGQAATDQEIQDYGYWVKLCESFLTSGDNENALEPCQKAANLNPTDPRIWTAVGQVNFNLGQYPEAIAAYGQSIKIQPEASGPRARQCQAYFELGQWDETIIGCDTALRLDGEWGEVKPAFAWYYKGQALEALSTEPGDQRHQQALESYRWANTIDPNYAPALAARCLLLSNMGEGREGLQWCRQALAVKDGLSRGEAALAWGNQARVEAQLGYYDQALQGFDQALALDPNNATFWTEQGMVLNVLGEDAEALVSHEWALKQKADYALALVNLCYTQNRLGSQAPTPEEAIAHYEAGLAACETSIQESDQRWRPQHPAMAWSERGNSLIGLERPAEALASANRAIALPGSNNLDRSEAWNTRSIALWHLGRYLDALNASEQALVLNGQSSRAWFNQGVILTSLGRYHDAINAYNQALLGDGNLNAKVSFVQIWTNQSAVYLQLEQYRDAINATDQALRLDVTHGGAWYNRGLAYFNLGNYPQAIANYNQGLKQEPTNDTLWTAKGLAYEEQGKFPQAIAAYQKALELNPAQSVALQHLQMLSPGASGS